MLNEAGRGRYQLASLPSAAAGAGEQLARSKAPVRVGVISDTHGCLRPEALAALRGADHLVHAGDIGKPGVLRELRAVAPLTAVRGNNDRGAWARTIPARIAVRVGGIVLYVLHDLKALDLDPVAAGFGVVVSGHSHQPRIEERDGVLYVNPGSAGPRRFRLPVSVAMLELDSGRVRARIELLHLPPKVEP
jgi:putative phosphoesterase